MLLQPYLDSPGEHKLYLPGKVGKLEAILAVPDEANTKFLALVGHPHSLQGGTMQNKVVTTLVRTFKALGIPSLRFNFRGVGESEGAYDEGIGESEDMLALVDLYQQEFPEVKLIFAGFSFGSYVAYRSAAQVASALLITIAPPVHHYDYTEYALTHAPWIIVQGDADEVVPESQVTDFARENSLLIPIMYFSETGHFFHGKLVELKERLLESIQAQVKME